MCFAEIVAWQPPGAGSRPVPIGSRFIGVSLQPAIPRRVAPQQSPLPLHQSPTILAQSQSGEAIKCAAQPHCKDAAQAVAPRLVVAPALAVSAANRSVISTLRAGCHFYLAPTSNAAEPGALCGTGATMLPENAASNQMSERYAHETPRSSARSHGAVARPGARLPVGSAAGLLDN